MTKNEIKKLSKKISAPNKRPAAKKEMLKTSLYLNQAIWSEFRTLTAEPRGQTSKVLEEFMSEYLKIHKKK